jgi:hypothetical protein
LEFDGASVYCGAYCKCVLAAVLFLKEVVIKNSKKNSKNSKKNSKNSKKNSKNSKKNLEFQEFQEFQKEFQQENTNDLS